AAVGLRATADSDDQSERKFQRRTQGNAPCVLLSLHRALWVRFLTRHGRNPANDEPREKIPSADAPRKKHAYRRRSRDTVRSHARSKRDQAQSCHTGFGSQAAIGALRVQLSARFCRPSLTDQSI